MKQQITPKHKKPQQPNTKQKKASQSGPFWMIGAVLLLTFIAYIPSLSADFVTWDDGDYVVNNFMIRNFVNISKFFTTPIQGNYHPLTMMSLAFNYALSGANASSYHLINILFHLLNTFLVLRFILLLSKGNHVAAIAVALLFGVHPMHVESVAWVAERKDVLYSFFFLLGMIFYLRFIVDAKPLNYVLVLFFFILSLASKPAAIIFPAALFALDFYRQRKISAKLILEKIPFLLFSLIFAYLALHGQTNVGAVDKANAFPLGSRILFAAYGYMMYFFKMVLPINLAAFYPFPPINVGLPMIYFLSPLFFVATAILCFVTWKKEREITFGFGFYLINLLLVLQFFIVGSAVIADRYTYMPYLGLFFIVGIYLSRKKLFNIHFNPYIVIMILGFVLTFLSYNQAATWKNSKTLWDQAVKAYPSATAYINDAIQLRKEGKRDSALAYYNIALKMNKQAHDGFCNRGNIYFDMGNDSLALQDYNQCLSINPNYVGALDNRGALYAREGRNELALTDLNRALALDTGYKMSYKNRGVALMNSGHHEEAIKDFIKFLTYEPKNAEIFNSLGVCYQYLKKYEFTLEPITKAIELTQQGVYYLNRSYSYNALGKLDAARKDAQTARSKGYPIPPEYAKYLGI